MTTNITSNGSKWAGETPDTIDDLLKVLASDPLDRVFEKYGNFTYPSEETKGMTRFFGNFRHRRDLSLADEGACEPEPAGPRRPGGYEEMKPSRKDRRSKRIPAAHRLLLTILSPTGSEIAKEIVTTVEVSSHGARVRGIRTFRPDSQGLLTQLGSG